MVPGKVLEGTTVRKLDDWPGELPSDVRPAARRLGEQAARADSKDQERLRNSGCEGVETRAVVFAGMTTLVQTNWVSSCVMVVHWAQDKLALDRS